MDPVDGQGLVPEPGGRAVEDQPQRAVPVLAGGEGLVEPADLGQPGAAKGGLDDEAALEDDRPLVAHRERVDFAEAPGAAAVALEVDVGAEEVEVRPRLSEPTEGGEFACEKNVVGVPEEDEVAGGGAPAGVAGGGHPSMGETHDLHPLAEAGEGAIERVGGAVVGDDHLQWRRLLRQDRLDCFADRLRSLVDRNDDREGRRAGSGSTVPTGPGPAPVPSRPRPSRRSSRRRSQAGQVAVRTLIRTVRGPSAARTSTRGSA